jgi:hypothetical protein
MDEAFGLSMKISGALFEDFCAKLSFTFGGEEFELMYAEEGEPFTLRRKSDGAAFEVELFAEVRAITDGRAGQ